MGILSYLLSKGKLKDVKPESENYDVRQNISDLHEDMAVVEELHYGYWKPRYLIDKRDNSKIQFMSMDERFCTVTEDDIAWESLATLDETCLERAKNLDIHFPTMIGLFKNGVAEVSWQLNPDGRYYMDEEGYGMTCDKQVEIYGYIDRKGKVVSKFRFINKDYKQLDRMRDEAENKVKSNIG